MQTARVLIVDDDRAIRESFADYLEDNGFVVLTAANGCEGLAAVKAERPDLILTDLRMPEMDGFEFMRQCADVAPGIPTIVISGVNQIENAVEALRLGAWNYIVKPVKDMQMLGHAVRRSLERARLLRENSEYQSHLEKLVEERTADMQRTHEQLLEREENLRLLINNMCDVVCRHDQDSTVTYASPSAEAMTGYSGEELLGTRVVDKIHPDDIEETKSVVNAAVERHDDNYLVQHRLRCKDGNYIWVETVGTLFYTPDGGLSEIQCNVRDITERKRSEKSEKELYAKFLEAQRRESLAVLAGGVAHDLNNVLGPILLLPAMIDDVLKDVSAADSEEVEAARVDLAMISDSAQRGSALIQALKSLGQHERVMLKTLDVNQFISSFFSSNDIKALMQEHPDVEFMSHLEMGALTIGGAYTSLHRALMNLVVNAAEAMVGKGRVQVGADAIELTEQKIGYELIEPGSYVVINVSDTGSGVQESLLATLFEPFVSTKKGAAGRSGSGLGLSVVSSVMKDHGGHLDVQTDVDGWSTTFLLYFPARVKAVGPEKRIEDIAPIEGGTEHILVVDDEQRQRFIARRCLEAFGYTVSEAASAQEALELFDIGAGEEELSRKKDSDRSAFDLVLMDMIMPGDKDGLDAYREILAVCPGKRFLFVSGHAEDDRSKAAIALGAAWLPKPYTRERLAAAVRQELDRS